MTFPGIYIIVALVLVILGSALLGLCLKFSLGWIGKDRVSFGGAWLTTLRCTVVSMIFSMVSEAAGRSVGVESALAGWISIGSVVAAFVISAVIVQWRHGKGFWHSMLILLAAEVMLMLATAPLLVGLYYLRRSAAG